MKFLFLLALSLSATSTFAQGLIFAEDVDMLIPGPVMITLSRDSHKDIMTLSSHKDGDRFRSPVEATNKESEVLLQSLMKTKNRDSKAELSCLGNTHYYNGAVKLNRLDLCIDRQTGKVVFQSNKISPEEAIKLQTKMEMVLNNDLDSSKVFPASKEPRVKIPSKVVAPIVPVVTLSSTEAIIQSPVAKCASGTDKVVLVLGNTPANVDTTFVGKSNSQDYVVMEPGAKITLYYCPMTIVVYENGKQKTIPVPLQHARLNINGMSKKSNCEYGDLSGNVNMIYNNSYMPVNIPLRPVLAQDKEASAFNKLCSDPTKPRSSIVPDGDFTRHE